jgi:VIT1/CCC1 family predicted Fe2+/Mn2+ transporter
VRSVRRERAKATTDGGLSDAATATFGLFDGIASCLGMILSLAILGQTQGFIVATVAGAVGAGASMGLGEWLSDRTASKRRALIMGLASFTGCISPAIPFFVFGFSTPGYVVCLVLAAALAYGISRLRPEPEPESYLRTGGVLIVATVLSVAAGVLV